MRDILLLFSPILIALLPGVWSFGHTKRMFWTLMFLLLGPVLVIMPGGMILGMFGVAWRCVVWRWCGLCILAGIVELFVWFGAYLWRGVPTEQWHRLIVWFCRGSVLVVVGAMCAAFVMFGSFFVLLCVDLDHTTERNGETVVAQYLWHDGYNYYDCYGPLVRGTNLLDGSAELDREHMSCDSENE